VKILPCPREQCRATRGGVALDRGGAAYYAERYPGRPGDSYRYVCSGCGRLCEISAQGFAALPEASVADLQAAGLIDHLTKDVRTAAGFQKEPAKAVDLFAAGIRTADEVTALLRPQEDLDAREVPDAAPRPEAAGGDPGKP
jgi:hypothetical protein